MNWVDIKSSLPDEYEYVLISYVDGFNNRIRFEPTVGYIKNKIWHTREGDIENHSTSYNYFKEHNLTPTHWMPLPKSPN